LTKRRATIANVVAASVLVALKLGVGLATGSLGLISTGIESSGDLIAATLTFFAVRLGGRPADPEHPYGHRRAENLGALGEAAILLAGAVVVTVQAIRHLVSGAEPPETHWFAFAVLAAALALDASRTAVSLRAAKAYSSPALRSNAMHFTADMAASATVLVGLVFVELGAAEADPIAALLVAALIAATATRLIGENANVLMDRTPEEAREAAERAITDVAADIELIRLRLRESAGRYFADVVVAVPPGQAVVEGHRAADLVEAAVQRTLPGSDVVVHVEPRSRDLSLRDRVLAIALEEPLVLEAHDIMIFQRPGGVSVALHLKFPADLDLGNAAQIAAQVERAISDRLHVAAVQTHLEPLEQTLRARQSEQRADAEAEDEIERLVSERTGRPPRHLELLSLENGRVVFLTLGVAAGRSLADAHALAGELEEQLRARVPDIVDVVVRTQP